MVQSDRSSEGPEPDPHRQEPRLAHYRPGGKAGGRQDRTKRHRPDPRLAGAYQQQATQRRHRTMVPWPATGRAQRYLTWTKVRIAVSLVAFGLVAYLYFFPSKTLFGIPTGISPPVPAIPQYPGTQQLSWHPTDRTSIVTRLVASNVTAVETTFETRDSPAAVFTSYAGSMRKAGWDALEKDATPGMNTALHFQVSQRRRWAKDKLTVVTVTAEPATDGLTRVALLKETGDW